MVFNRTKAYGWIFIFLFITFIPLVIWLFISLMSSKGSPETLLVIMAILCSCLDILFLILFIVYILQKKDAITLQTDRVILKTYKEQVIEFKDIKDIRKHCTYVGPRGGLIAASIGILSSGYIVFTLNDDKKIYIRDIKNVSEVCFVLREKILNIKR